MEQILSFASFWSWQTPKDQILRHWREASQYSGKGFGARQPGSSSAFATHSPCVSGMFFKVEAPRVRNGDGNSHNYIL